MQKQIPEPAQNGFEMIGRLCLAGIAIVGIGALIEAYENTKAIATPAEQMQQAQKNQEEISKMRAQPQAPQAENKSKWMDPAEHTVPLDIRTDR